MLRKVLTLVLTLFSVHSFSQSNLIFSVPQEYNFNIEIGSLSYTKPRTWQLRFNNVSEGEYPITITVSKPNTTYKQTLKTRIEVDNGLEKTYFIIPYQGGIEVHLAVVYNLRDISNNNNNPNTTSDGRFTTYQNKPVYSKADILDLKKRAVDLSFDSKMLEFLKSVIKNGWLYSEDVAVLLGAFSFDSYRLELAKFAYDYTIDKHKYYTLSNSFEYSSYYQSLMSYIKNR